MKELIEIITVKNILIYFLIINIVGFLSMWIDKRKSQNNGWRISENTLMTISALGGAIGSTIGMYTVRHKTKKLKFTIGIPTIFITEVILIVYLIIKFY